MERSGEKYGNGVQLSARQSKPVAVPRSWRSGWWSVSLTPLTLPLLLFAVTVLPGSAGAFTEGSGNNFFGTDAGSSITSGNGNSFFGGSSGAATTTGISNSFFGYGTGDSNTTGRDNAFFGYYSGYFNTTGNYNSSFGVYSGLNNKTGSFNSSFGRYSGYYNSVENYNTFIGYAADLYPGGAPATNPVTNATAIGAMSIVAQSNSLVLGSIKGWNGATTNVNVGIGTAAPARQLHIVGDNAVFRMDRPTDTVGFMLVRTDLYGNPLKTFLVGANASGTNTGELVVNDMGTAVGGAGIRRMTIANNGSVQFTGAVTAATYYAASSMALKDNIRTYEHAVETVNRLRGVRFDWKDSGQPAVGLIAEEVEKVVPEVVTHKEDGKASGVNYASLVGVLVEAVKEQQAKIGQQQAEMDSLKGTLQQQQEAKAGQQQANLDRQQAEIDSLKGTLQQQQEAIAQLLAELSAMRNKGMLAQR